MNVFVFDIETIPDVQSARRLNPSFQHLSDEQVAEALFAARRQETNGSEFLPLHMQKIACISVVLRSGSRLKVWSLGEEQSSEKEVITRFFAGIERYQPTLVSWNGSAFDLPLLHYRALQHGVVSPTYWNIGEEDTNFRWNNYLNRYHYRHTDVMDMLSGYQARASAPLDTIASLLGFPGKMGMDGSQVWPEYLKGNLPKIRDYCESDVLNTYLVFLRFEYIRGRLSEDYYFDELTRLREWLLTASKPSFNSFVEAWDAAATALSEIA